MILGLNHMILNPHVQEFLPKFEILEQYRSAYRVSHIGTVDTRRKLNGTNPSKLGDIWKPMSLCSSSRYGVLTVGLTCDGKVYAKPVKELVCNLFIRQLRFGEYVYCVDGDESNIHCCNLEISPGKYTRRAHYGKGIKR